MDASGKDRRMMELKVSCPPSEISEQFLQGMVNRMAVSFYKYGKVAEAYPDKVQAVASLTQRLREYAKTGNTEYLIDAANFAMIEFMYPAREGAYFRGTDDDGSPGRITAAGRADKRANAAL